jgi:hypothetical protein
MKLVVQLKKFKGVNVCQSSGTPPAPMIMITCTTMTAIPIITMLKPLLSQPQTIAATKYMTAENRMNTDAPKSLFTAALVQKAILVREALKALLVLLENGVRKAALAVLVMMVAQAVLVP